MSVSPSQIFSYLIQQHGVSTAAAAGILANIQYESNFNPSAVGDNGTSGGLFQHHKGRWDNLKSYAASTGRSWSDWTAQVDFAMKEARAMGINLSATDPVAASKEWTIRFERPANMYEKANQRAGAVGQYMALDPDADYTQPTRPGDGNANVSEAQEQMNIPDGGSWFQADDGNYYVAFRFYGDDSQEGPSEVVYYRADGPPPQGTKLHSSTSWNRYKDQWVDGGTTDAFRGVAAGQSYQDLVNQTLFELGLSGSDALQDRGVLNVVAIAMTREMSPSELANRLQNTQWFNSRTDKEREWDDLSDAEKDQRIQDSMSQLASSWFTYVGEDLDLGQYDTDGDGLVSAEELRAGNPDLFTWSQRVASGQASVVTAVNTWMKDVALENEDSPWARTVRDEERAQGQFGVDVSNTAGEIRDMYNRWGVEISDQEAEKLANDVVMNNMSIEDVEQDLKDQANALYPHKPPDMATRDYAKPFMQTYMNVLEVSEPDLNDDHIQAALSDGMNLGEFRKQLRNDDRWMDTKNARDEMNQKISRLGQMMGY